MIHKYLPQNKNKRESIYRIQMVAFTYFIYSLFNMARRPISVVKSAIIHECNATVEHDILNRTWCEEILVLSSAEEFLGLMDFLFMFSYGVCLYLSGIIADCYNPRYYLTAGCFVSGFFCALMGLTDYWNLRSFKFLGTMLILFGASQSTSWPVVLSSVTHWYGFKGKRRGMFFGFWNTHNYLGSMLGILLASIWVERRWMWSFFVPGFILAFAGFFVCAFMVVDPKDLKELDKEKSDSFGRRQSSRREIPQWLSTKTSITMYEAYSIPGVIEFSTCMFFSRMVGYIFLLWLPVLVQEVKSETATRAAYYSMAYVIGGSCGGILAGILGDLSHKRALISSIFLLLSIPILLLGLLTEYGNFNTDLMLFFIIGLSVEAPYVVISTSISADLSTHKLVKRNHRALSTIAGIIEGTGAIGASIGTYTSGIILVNTKWTTILYIMAACQILAVCCLGRQAIRDFRREEKEERISDYLKLPSFS